MPTPKEVNLIADILSDPVCSSKTAEEVAAEVLLAVEQFRASAYKYTVVARYGSDWYVSYPCKTKPQAVTVARVLIRLHKLERIAILPAGDPDGTPPASTSDWLWISSAEIVRMSEEPPDEE